MWAIRRRNGGIDGSEDLLDETVARWEEWVDVVAVDDMIEKLKAMMVGASFPDSDGGWDSALEDVAEWLKGQRTEPTR